MTRSLEACDEGIFFSFSAKNVWCIVAGKTGDGNLNAIRVSLSGLLEWRRQLSFVGKMTKIPGQLLPLVKRAQTAARSGVVWCATSSNPGPAPTRATRSNAQVPLSLGGSLWSGGIGQGA
jgi:hypothetical protein